MELFQWNGSRTFIVEYMGSQIRVIHLMTSELIGMIDFFSKLHELAHHSNSLLYDIAWVSVTVSHLFSLKLLSSSRSHRSQKIAVAFRLISVWLRQQFFDCGVKETKKKLLTVIQSLKPMQNHKKVNHYVVQIGFDL